MRIKLVIASDDADYAKHLSDYISRQYSDTIAVTLCMTRHRFQALLETQRFDVALIDPQLAEGLDLSSIGLPLVLEESNSHEEHNRTGISTITKYQRISAMVSEFLCGCAKASKYGAGANSEQACITAVWSPAGGVGKTTVALSYAAKKVSEGKQVLYLNLEPFSSVPAYFAQSGKSISAAFEMLGNGEGNVRMLIRGICQQDRGAGVAYFCRPENFDDMYALSAENIAELTTVCAGVTDELVIDMSCVCDWRTRKVFDLADRIFLVTDQSAASEVKIAQFTSQHNVFDSIKDKLVLIANKGASVSTRISGTIHNLPLVSSVDSTEVYKALSGSMELVPG